MPHPSDYATTVLPTMIGSYRVLHMIGEGGMGSVYLAEHTLIGRRAAVKVLHPSLCARQEIIDRFFNEARASTSIADPGIVQVFDFGYHGNTAYIVMEYLEGESLEARLRRLGRLPYVDVLRLARQLSLSLHAAHARGVVHRDLKPDNVFVVADPEALNGERTKILDFGIAKLTDGGDRVRVTQTGAVMGTPVYMSPEQCRGTGRVDHRSDIYSLGCVLFHLLVGRPPFESEGTGELFIMHVRDPAPPPSKFVHVPPEIDTIVLRCLAKLPEERYQSMHELATAVDAMLRKCTNPPGTSAGFLTPLPPPATLPPKPTTLSGSAAQATPAPAARTRWPIALAVAGLLVGAGVASIVVLRRGDTTQQPTPAGAPTTSASTNAIAPNATVPSAPSATVPSTTTPSTTSPTTTVPASANTPSATVPNTTAPSMTAPTTTAPSATTTVPNATATKPVPAKSSHKHRKQPVTPAPSDDPYNDR